MPVLNQIKMQHKNKQTNKQTKKRWQEYTEELYKKGLNDLDNHEGVVTYLEPDNLEYEVNWALGSITTNKSSEGDEIPAISNPKR